jgi:predicted transporter
LMFSASSTGEKCLGAIRVAIVCLSQVLDCWVFFSSFYSGQTFTAAVSKLIISIYFTHKTGMACSN